MCEEIVSNDYNSGVTNMNGSATYDIYLDRGGFLAAFTGLQRRRLHAHR